jgi:hypothetical protein
VLSGKYGKVWFDGPTFPPIPIVNAGADCQLALPGGFDMNWGPAPLFVVDPIHPRGEYEYSCRLLDCATGQTLALDQNLFNIIDE